MKIVKVSPTPNRIGFEMTIDFSLWHEEYWPGNNEVETSLKSISYWVSQTFKSNYIILEYSSKIIGGGSTDNTKNWDDHWNKDGKPSPTGNYQLRCSEADCTLFLLKYSERK